MYKYKLYKKRRKTVAVQPESPKNWSHYQQAVFEYGAMGTGSAVVESVAGSGKTSTAVELAKHLPPQSKIAFMAFNKHIADTLKAKVAAAFVGTSHGLGLRAIKRVYPKTRINVAKNKEILDRFPQLDGDGMKRTKFLLSSIMGIVKNTLTDYNDAAAVEKLAREYDFMPEAVEMLALVPDALKIGIALAENQIDFDDMLWLPAVGIIELEKFDVLICDEAQDFNNCQIQIALRSLSENGRLFAFGDSFQSCYAFRGANSDSMNKLKAATSAVSLPLSISYRCPVKHVELAKSLVPHIEYAEGAALGEVVNSSLNSYLTQIEDKAMIICRINAPLIQTALQLLKQGRKCYVKGKDIGVSLIGIINMLQESNVSLLLQKLARYDAAETERLGDSYFNQDKLAIHKDKVQCIEALCEGMINTYEVVQRINNVFSDEAQEGITASTVHKAKGLEAENVYILQPDMLGTNKKGGDEEDAQQELNIKYVAYTRATKKLVFVR